MHHNSIRAVLDCWDQQTNYTSFERAERVRPLLEAVGVQCDVGPGRGMVYKLNNVFYRNLPPLIRGLRHLMEYVHIKMSWTCVFKLNFEDAVSTKKIHEAYIQYMRDQAQAVFCIKGQEEEIDPATMMVDVTDRDDEGDICIEAHMRNPPLVFTNGNIDVIIRYALDFKVREHYKMEKVFEAFKEYLKGLGQSRVAFRTGTEVWLNEDDILIDDDVMIVNDPLTNRVLLRAYKTI